MSALQLGMLGVPSEPPHVIFMRERFEKWGGGYAAEPGTGPEGYVCRECVLREVEGYYSRRPRSYCFHSRGARDLGVPATIDPEAPACERYMEEGECC